MKLCSTCKEVKCELEYSKDSSRIDGLQRRCRWCDRLHSIRRQIKKGSWSFIKKKPKKVKRKSGFRQCRVCKSVYEVSHYIGTTLCSKCLVIRDSPEVKEKKRIRLLEASKRYNKKNPEKAKESYKKWAKENKSDRHKLRMATEPEYALIFRMRDILNRTLRRSKSIKSAASAEVQLGYTKCQLKAHLESLFLDGMSWENRGDWHIDHIKPISVMVSLGETNPSVINALSNLQPLWAKDNLSKGAKFDRLK